MLMVGATDGNENMTDWIGFVVAFGVVAPWLFAGAGLLTEWTCDVLSHGWRMRTDPMCREVEIQFRVELAEAGLDGKDHQRSVNTLVVVGRRDSLVPSTRHTLALVNAMAVVDDRAAHRDGVRGHPRHRRVPELDDRFVRPSPRGAP